MPSKILICGHTRRLCRRVWPQKGISGAAPPPPNPHCVNAVIQGAAMQLEDLRQIHDGYDHIYLSPHLDDAVLSCGGAIARHTSAGARVLVVTLCTAAPPPDGPLSRFAQNHHLMWGLVPERAMAEREREDDLALER